jgi:hypothetical protein
VRGARHQTCCMATRQHAAPKAAQHSHGLLLPPPRAHACRLSKLASLLADDTTAARRLALRAPEVLAVSYEALQQQMALPASLGLSPAGARPPLPPPPPLPPGPPPAFAAACSSLASSPAYPWPSRFRSLTCSCACARALQMVSTAPCSLAPPSPAVTRPPLLITSAAWCRRRTGHVLCPAGVPAPRGPGQAGCLPTPHRPSQRRGGRCPGGQRAAWRQRRCRQQRCRHLPWCRYRDPGAAAGGQRSPGGCYGRSTRVKGLAAAAAGPGCGRVSMAAAAPAVPALGCAESALSPGACLVGLEAGV